MSDFADNEELLQDFLNEAGELLADVDNKLVGLEKDAANRELLNSIFRGFHTIKGGAGFLGVTELVALCHRTENLFDKLRNGEVALSAELLDVILEATAQVREMFGALEKRMMPGAADPSLLAALEGAAEGKVAAAPTNTVQPATPAAAAPQAGAELDWAKLHAALTGAENAPQPAERAASPGRRASDQDNANFAKSGRREPDKVAVKESTIRIDTSRLDQVLNLSGEIGLTKNRLTCLRHEIMQGKNDGETLRAFDEAVSQLDLLVSDLQNAVMKTRMQPVGRLFQKYPRMARDLARQLGKDVELSISGEDTELDRTMIDELADPLVHLVRNAVDHGIETVEDRRAAGKPEKSILKLSAEQVGDRIILEITDDGRGMRADKLRAKALEKGLIDLDAANSMDDKQALQLIFLPGFSTKDQISDVSGRGVGMDVVKTNIQKLNGWIDIVSAPGQGTTISIALPLTLAILPVLVVRAAEQPFAVPLAMVREMIPIETDKVQPVSGRATMVVRGDVLPVRTLQTLLGWPDRDAPRFGVLLDSSKGAFVLGVDGFVGRDDVVIKPLAGIKPKGVAGATLSGDGSVVLVLDVEELIAQKGAGAPLGLFVPTTEPSAVVEQ
jgi:two-component system, chemotaxis family, sensor kinase CheA